MMGTWSDQEHQEYVDMKRRKRFEQIDSYPPEIRALINEYSLNVVRACLDLGIKKPQQIKHLVQTVLDEFSPTRGSFAIQGIRNQIHPPK